MFITFKHLHDGQLHLDASKIVGVGDGAELGRASIWVEGQPEAFQIVGDPALIRDQIETARCAQSGSNYQKPLG